jgi:chromosome segregation ATPase
MEILTQEKVALAQALANEKESLMTNNQDLTEQLKKCFNQLQETAALLEKEQKLNLELENSKIQVEEEKTTFQQQLREQEQENSKLQTLFLKLEAALEKEKSISMESQTVLKEKQELLESLQGDLQYATKSRDDLEQERDDLQHQIAVLAEERDAARAHEEDLFEKLTDVTNDLERLQESYVVIADRCNDAQDEVSELRDQIQNLQEALAVQRSAFHRQTIAAVQPILVTSEPKLPAEEAAPQPAHKRVGSKSIPTAPARKSDILISEDDSKPSMIKSKSKNVDDEYQDDYEDDFN